MSNKIKTSHVYPPIPIREFDWQAYYDGEEEAGQYGHGRTEAAAVVDLIENHPRGGVWCEREGRQS